MTVQLAALCDSAADYSGKLCVLGVFDTLCARELPVVHPHCALVLRLLFESSEGGRHTFQIRCIDPAGKECLPPIEPAMEVAFPPTFSPFVSRNLVLNLQRIRFERHGVYRWSVQHDGRTLATIPLRVTLIDESRAATGPAG